MTSVVATAVRRICNRVAAYYSNNSDINSVAENHRGWLAITAAQFKAVDTKHLFPNHTETSDTGHCKHACSPQLPLSPRQAYAAQGNTRTLYWHGTSRVDCEYATSHNCSFLTNTYMAKTDLKVEVRTSRTSRKRATGRQLPKHGLPKHEFKNPRLAGIHI